MARAADIVTDTSRCTGCRLCMLACSFANQRVNRPEAAHIRVEVNEKEFACSIVIDRDRCRRCLVCVEFCESGALKAGEAEAAVRAEGA